MYGVLAGILFVSSLATIDRDPIRHLLFFLVSSAGLFGATCFWWACFKPVNATVRSGLAIGIMAMAAVLYYFISTLDGSYYTRNLQGLPGLMWISLAALPIACAAFLIAESARRGPVAISPENKD